MDRRLFIYFIPGISEYLKKALYQSCFSLAEISTFGPEVSDYLGMGNYSFDAGLTTSQAEEAQRFLDAGRLRGFCCIEDEDYPGLLKGNRYSPFGLFYEGAMRRSWDGCVCAVGTRHPIGECQQSAYRFALECGLNGVDVVSGLAVGIDQATMTGCLDGGGKSYGVLGCGLGVPYPANSQHLKERIIGAGGAMISQFPPMMRPNDYNFPQRNLVLAQMTMNVVAFQAPRRSGVMITVHHALSCGRDVWVHECGVGPQSLKAGTDSLVRDGAPVISSISDLIPDARNTRVRRVPYSSSFELEHANLYRFREAWYIQGDEKQ